MNRQAKDVFQVLVADDSADDRYLLRTAMRRATRLQIVAEVADGDEAIAYLKKQAAGRNRDEAMLPDLLLLDLRMPVRDGFDVLKWLQAQRLNRLTVVALTDSIEPEHIRRALDLGADLFQVKPTQHHERIAMVLALEQYLLTAGLMAAPRHVSDSVVPQHHSHRMAASAR